MTVMPVVFVSVLVEAGFVGVALSDRRWDVAVAACVLIVLTLAAQWRVNREDVARKVAR